MLNLSKTLKSFSLSYQTMRTIISDNKEYELLSNVYIWYGDDDLHCENKLDKPRTDEEIKNDWIERTGIEDIIITDAEGIHQESLPEMRAVFGYDPNKA